MNKWINVGIYESTNEWLIVGMDVFNWILKWFINEQIVKYSSTFDILIFNFYI